MALDGRIPRFKLKYVAGLRGPIGPPGDLTPAAQELLDETQSVAQAAIDASSEAVAAQTDIATKYPVMVQASADAVDAADRANDDATSAHTDATSAAAWGSGAGYAIFATKSGLDGDTTSLRGEVTDDGTNTGVYGRSTPGNAGTAWTKLGDYTTASLAQRSNLKFRRVIVEQDDGWYGVESVTTDQNHNEAYRTTSGESAPTTLDGSVPEWSDDVNKWLSTNVSYHAIARAKAIDAGTFPVPDATTSDVSQLRLITDAAMLSTMWPPASTCIPQVTNVLINGEMYGYGTCYGDMIPGHDPEASDGCQQTVWFFRWKYADLPATTDTSPASTNITDMTPYVQLLAALTGVTDSIYCADNTLVYFKDEQKLVWKNLFQTSGKSQTTYAWVLNNPTTLTPPNLSSGANGTVSFGSPTFVGYDYPFQGEWIGGEFRFCMGTKNTKTPHGYPRYMRGFLYNGSYYAEQISVLPGLGSSTRATGTASFSGTTMTVATTTTNPLPQRTDAVVASGVPAGTTIVSYGTRDPVTGVGTYSISANVGTLTTRAFTTTRNNDDYPEPTVVHMGGSVVMCNMRGRDGQYTCWSFDDGRTWTTPVKSWQETHPASTNSKASMRRTPEFTRGARDGLISYVGNSASSRRNMSIWWSPKGASWTQESDVFYYDPPLIIDNRLLTAGADGPSQTYPSQDWMLDAYGNWTREVAIVNDRGRSRSFYPDTQTNTSATFVGSVNGTVLTASGVVGSIGNGQKFGFPPTGTIAAGTVIVSQLTGTAGGDGTYRISIDNGIIAPTDACSSVVNYGTSGTVCYPGWDLYLLEFAADAPHAPTNFRRWTFLPPGSPAP